MSIYKVEGGFFVALENKQFKPSNRDSQISIASTDEEIQNNEFKPIEQKYALNFSQNCEKERRPGRNSNPSRLRDRQS